MIFENNQNGSLTYAYPSTDRFSLEENGMVLEGKKVLQYVEDWSQGVLVPYFRSEDLALSRLMFP